MQCAHCLEALHRVICGAPTWDCCVCVCVCVCVCARGGGACRAVRLARTYAQARVRLTHPAGTAIMWALTDLDPALHRHLTRAPSNMVTAL